MSHYNSNHFGCGFAVGQELRKLIREHPKAGSPIVLLCIGTDRSTGDSLGPLIGYKLSRRKLRGLTIYGTLNSPVHAMNLEETLAHIKEKHPNACIGCRSCEAVCPQQIKISEAMSDFAGKLGS